MNKFTADFETATWLENETFVCAWAVCNIETKEIEIGNTMESFIKWCIENVGSTVYFHNAKFDCEFIFYYLLTNGYTHIKDGKEAQDKTFTTLISEMGQFYSTTIYFEVIGKHRKKITIFDSLKIIPFSVEKIAKGFGLEISKLKIDYNKPREEGHILTKEEKEYIENDVLIVAYALEDIFTENLDRMTQGSNALKDYKSEFKTSRWDRLFPELKKELDEELRHSYKGGFTYLVPEFAEKDLENVISLDVNSLYPSCMMFEKLPFGEPIFFEGKYEEDKIYDLYIQKISCSFELKKNKIPTIQIKGTKRYLPNEYVTSSGYEMETLYLTSVDLQLFFEHYDVYELKYHYGWKFKSKNGIFEEYVNKWITRKNKATIEKNYAQRTIAKLMLNSLYGKFATKLEAKRKTPYLQIDESVRYKTEEKEDKKGLYIPIRKFYNSFC